MSEVPVRRARVTDIIILASQMSGFDRKVITGQARAAPIMRVRQAVYRVAREHGHSYPMIGRIMGGRDHSTILHGAEQVDIHYARSSDYAAFVDRLRAAAEVAEPFIMRAPPVPVEVVPAKPAPIVSTLKPKNDFSADAETEDGGHRFHAGIAEANAGFLEALRGAA